MHEYIGHLGPHFYCFICINTQAMADLERSDPNYDAENTRVAPNLHKKSSNLH